MKNLLFLSLIPILFTACNSENEDKAVNEILEVYGGNVTSSTGFKTSTDEGTIKYFKVEIDNPAFFEEGVDRSAVAGGAALILYNNFSEEERNKYNQYEITFKNGMNENYFLFPGTLIKEFHTQEKIAKTYLRELAEGKYENVSNNYIEEKKTSTTPDSLELSFSPIKNYFGQLIRIDNIFCKKVDYITMTNQKIDAMQFVGYLVKKEGKIQYYITLNPSVNRLNILKISGGLVPNEEPGN